MKLPLAEKLPGEVDGILHCAWNQRVVDQFRLPFYVYVGIMSKESSDIRLHDHGTPLQKSHIFSYAAGRDRKDPTTASYGNWYQRKIQKDTVVPTCTIEYDSMVWIF
jgi:hypothetical protein